MALMWWMPSSFKPIAGQASGAVTLRIIATVRDGSLIPRFGRARRDPEMAVLEGLHAVKHALRFGARLEVLATPDLAALTGLAEQLAPDVAGQMAQLAHEVDPDVYAQLAPLAPARAPSPSPSAPPSSRRRCWHEPGPRR